MSLYRSNDPATASCSRQERVPTSSITVSGVDSVVAFGFGADSSLRTRNAGVDSSVRVGYGGGVGSYATRREVVAGHLGSGSVPHGMDGTMFLSEGPGNERSSYMDSHWQGRRLKAMGGEYWDPDWLSEDVGIEKLQEKREREFTREDLTHLLNVCDDSLEAVRDLCAELGSEGLEGYAARLEWLKLSLDHAIEQVWKAYQQWNRLSEGSTGGQWYQVKLKLAEAVREVTELCGTVGHRAVWPWEKEEGSEGVGEKKEAGLEESEGWDENEELRHEGYAGDQERGAHLEGGDEEGNEEDNEETKAEEKSPKEDLDTLLDASEVSLTYAKHLHATLGEANSEGYTERLESLKLALENAANRGLNAWQECKRLSGEGVGGWQIFERIKNRLEGAAIEVKSICKLRGYDIEMEWLKHVQVAESRKEGQQESSQYEEENNKPKPFGCVKDSHGVDPASNFPSAQADPRSQQDPNQWTSSPLADFITTVEDLRSRVDPVI